MPIYPYSFQLPPLNVQDIPNDGVPGEFLGISAGGQLDWLPAGGGGGSGDMLAANNLSELTNFATARTNIGLGTASTPTFANLTLTSPSLSSSAPVTISQTWNQIGTAFTAFKVNAVSTASASSSLLADFQLGTVSKLKVDKNGGLISSSGSLSGLFLSSGTDGMEVVGGALFAFSSSNIVATINRSAVKGFSTTWDGAFAFGTSNTNANVSGADTILLRDATNTLALRNGANTQTFNVYGSYGSISDYKRLSISCDQTTGNATITNQAAGYTAGTVSINGVPVGLGKGNISSNVAIGSNALQANTTGGQNSSLGFNALFSNTTGSQNCSFGLNSLYLNTTSGGNSSFGFNSLFSSTGAQNSAFGLNSLQNTTTGGNNSALGANSLNGNSTGGNNSGFGFDAGRFIADGITTNSTGGDSVFLGAATKALGAGQTNQIVIGHSATGIGSNSVVLGNDSIEKTALKGNVGIGTTAPGAKLHVAGNGLFGENTGVVTATPVNVSFGGTVGAFAPGNKGNLKWDLYNDGTTALRYGIGMSANLMEFQTGSLGGFGFYPGNTTTSALHIITGGNVGIGTTSPTSKLHVEGGTNPTITLRNTSATGYGQLLFQNTVVTGAGLWLNGSTQTDFGGASSLNFYAAASNIAFHTASVTNALSIAQSGNVSAGRIICPTFQTSTIINANDTKFFWGFSNSSEVAIFANLQTTPIMQFAGTTNLFPAIKRSTVRLQARLADDSGFTNIQGKLTTDTDYTATVVTPTGFLTLYDAQGNAYKVPCVAA